MRLSSVSLMQGGSFSLSRAYVECMAAQLVGVAVCLRCKMRVMIYTSRPHPSCRYSIVSTCTKVTILA
jgi:hypothetical protein